jgi:beta-phosphoglucomutase-like phosphatase (HAD superfamily)
VKEHMDALRVALGDIGPILLDFDGPVCAVFSGHPAPIVAQDLRAVIEAAGVRIPTDLQGESDPMEILKWSAHAGSEGLVNRVDDALRSAEMVAVRTSAPTPFAREIIVAAKESGRSVAIVSNNSAEAISTYLANHRLSSYISPVVGRACAEPARMKPSPGPVLAALANLGSGPEDAVLIGDSLSDIRASQAAGVRVIAYANKAHKVEPFRDAGANAVVTTLADVASILAGLSPQHLQ